MKSLIEEEQGYFRSSSGNADIKYYIYKPRKNCIKGIIQIAHGMCQYMLRYKDCVTYFVLKGFIVCGHDHLGHGGSVKSIQSLGYIAKEEGYVYLVKDMYSLTCSMKEKYTDLSYFILGHSMGSLMARSYITHYREAIDGVILTGTVAKNPLINVGIGIARIEKYFLGGRHRSKFLEVLAFGRYYSHCEDKQTHFEWMSRNRDMIKAYLEDPYCHFVFTTSGFEDLFQLLKRVSGTEWAKKVPADLPIILLSGMRDPVGNYGKGVKKIAMLLKQTNHQQVKLKLYTKARHELLAELNREEVYNDIYKWLLIQLVQKKSRIYEN